MRKYSEYKNSGVVWIKEMPKHWQVKALKYFSSVNDDVLTEQTDPEFEFRYIDIGSVSIEEGISQYQKFTFKNAPSRARRLVKNGDVIVSTVRTYLKAVANISESKDVVVSTGFAVVRSKDVNSNFLKYMLINHYFVETILIKS